MPFPPPPSSGLTIFDSEPPADAATFAAGVAATNTSADSLAVILFSPNLQIVASMDNTNSQVTSSYSTSVTHGFTFSTTQSLSITQEVGVSIEIVTAKVSVTFALSFTEQWNESSTLTLMFSCPPGEKAFVYQGTLLSKILQFSAEDATYAWTGAAGKALTQVLVTSGVPIGSAPSNPVTMSS